MRERTDKTQITFRLEFEKGDRKATKYFHNERPLKRRYNKEIENNPIISFYQDGTWIGYDWVPKVKHEPERTMESFEKNDRDIYQE